MLLLEEEAQEMQEDEECRHMLEGVKKAGNSTT